MKLKSIFALAIASTFLGFAALATEAKSDKLQDRFLGLWQGPSKVFAVEAGFGDGAYPFPPSETGFLCKVLEVKVLKAYADSVDLFSVQSRCLDAGISLEASRFFNWHYQMKLRMVSGETMSSFEEEFPYQIFNHIMQGEGNAIGFDRYYSEGNEKKITLRSYLNKIN